MHSSGPLLLLDTFVEGAYHFIGYTINEEVGDGVASCTLTACGQDRDKALWTVKIQRAFLMFIRDHETESFLHIIKKEGHYDRT